MKKISLSISALFSILISNAQEIVPEPNIIFGTPQLHGTARFQGMGGAMGAVGADGSAVSINPAGSGLFNYNHFSISGELINSKNKNTYLGNTNNTKENEFHIPNMSAFFTHHTEKEGITKVSFGFTYQTQKKLDGYNFSSGTNKNSAVDYFLNQANNGYNTGSVPLDLVQTQNNETVGDLYEWLNSQAYGFNAQQALLGYQGYLINHTENGYTSNMQAGDYYQENAVYTSGFQSKLTGNIALEINDKFYVGANVNVHFTDQMKQSSFYEENTNTISSGLKRYEFNNTTYTYGNGYSFQLGGIAKVTEEFRIGASYQSPTVNSLNDEFQQSLYSQYYDENSILQNVSVNPNVITAYKTYKTVTPGSITGSMSYIFGKKGLISLDYERKDFSKTKFKDDQGSFAILNNYYKSELQATNDIRVGGEYRIENISLRAGYRFINSPYKNDAMIGDYNAVSAGFGYSYRTSRIDLGYTFAHQATKEYPISSGINNTNNIKSKNNIFNISYSVNF